MQNDEIRKAISLLRQNGYTVTPPTPDDALFDDFWRLYGKKVDRRRTLTRWRRLSKDDRQAALAYIPAYVKATPDIQFRRNPLTFLNNRTWENPLPCAHAPQPSPSVDYGELLQQSHIDEESRLHEKRQRILRMIEAVRQNPQSIMRKSLIMMRDSGLLKELHIEWQP